MNCVSVRKDTSHISVFGGGGGGGEKHVCLHACKRD